MNDKYSDNAGMEGRDRPDPLASLIRKAGNMPEPSEAFRTRLHGELKDAWQQQLVHRRQRRLRSSFAVAACLLLLTITAWVLLQPEPVSQTAGTVLRSSPGLQIVETDGSAREAVVGDMIPAGSRVVTADSPAAFELGQDLNVRLDARTRLVVNNAMQLVLESGRVYVDSGVTATEIIINTPIGTVRDIGTQFVVALEPDVLAVQVRDGFVKIEKSASSFPVSPGQRVQLDNRGEIQTETIELSGDAWRWVEAVAPALEVKDRSVADFLGTIHRETGLEIRYETQDAARNAARTIIGGQHPDLPPRQLLDVVMAATHFRYVVDDSSIVIRENNQLP